MQNDFRDQLNAAQGKTPCDLLLKNAEVFDVFSGRFIQSDLAIHRGVIVGFDKDIQTKASRVLDLKNRSIVPGFIDAHVHIESSCMTPGAFEKAVLSKGTTSAICDPHELANVQGPKGIQYFLDASLRMKLNLQVMMSSCVPATHLETNGGGALDAQTLSKLSSHPNALGLAEMMNVPGVLNGDPDILAKLDAFRGRPIDGHAPLLRGDALSAYACAGITSCHESSELEEALEKVRKGIAVWIREGSVAKDLHTLMPILDAYRSAFVGFCTDDRNPLDISTEGHIDYLIREFLKAGVAPETVYRASSWSIARHYGLDRLTKTRSTRVGALAPGYLADLVILNDRKTCEIENVIKSGQFVSDLEFDSTLSKTTEFKNSIRANIPAEEDLEGPTGPVHVIKVIAGKIITDRMVAAHNKEGVAKLTVLERHGKGLKPSNAYVHGFGKSFHGAIASSVGHDSHNLIVVGSKTSDMKVALAHLIQCGGGFCVVSSGKVIADLPLPIGGLMSTMDATQMITKLKLLRDASRTIGCDLAEPFLQLAFLSLPVIPSLKLTDQGLVDVEKFSFISVRAS